MSVKICVYPEITVDAYERKKILEELLKKETVTLRRVLLKKELTSLQLQIDMYEMHLKEKRQRELKESERKKQIEREQNLGFFIIVCVILTILTISFIRLQYESKIAYDEASKPFVFKKKN